MKPGWMRKLTGSKSIKLRRICVLDKGVVGPHGVAFFQDFADLRFVIVVHEGQHYPDVHGGTAVADASL